MSEEMNYGVRPVVVMEDGYKNGGGVPLIATNKKSPMSPCPPNLDDHEVLTTVNELPEGFSLKGGVEEGETVSVERSPVMRPWEDPISFPIKVSNHYIVAKVVKKK